MSAKISGIEATNAAFRKKIGEITGAMTEKTLMQVLITGRSNAMALVPRDTGNLINSVFTEVQNGIGRVGFTAEYAGWVHDMPGKLKGQPRAHFGKTRAGVEFGGGTGVGRYWDPDAEPQFLKKGFERDGKDTIEAIIKAGYK